MTDGHPRDPRLRRQHRDPLDAAVRLEVAVDGMRAAQLQRGAELIEWHPDTGEALSADVLTAVQLGTVEPPLTAQEFADALAAVDDDPEPWRTALIDGLEQHRPVDVAESPEPAPALLPPAPAPVPIALVPDESGRLHLPVFSSERPGPVAGWRSRHDARSLGFSAARLLAGSAPMQSVRLETGPVFDQATAGPSERDQSCCVGCGWAAAVNVLRIRQGLAPLTLADAEALYVRAQQLDAVPGEDYPGTSVLAGAQAAVEAGELGGYLWAFGTRPIAQTIVQQQLPVVVGVRWLSGMWDTGPGGLVLVQGEDVGLGHCLAVVGIEPKGPQGQPGPYFVWQQSVGTGYGDGGFGYIHHRDLAGLLHGIGEAAVPTVAAQASA